MCDDLIPDDNEDALEQEEDNIEQGGGLGRKRPDAWAIRWDADTVYILEFTRPFDSAPDWDAATDRYKQRKYQPIRDRISQSLPTWTVKVLTFTLGTRGSFNEKDWKQNLNLLGVSESDQSRLMAKLVNVCLSELTEVFKTRNALVSQKELTAS